MKRLGISLAIAAVMMLLNLGSLHLSSRRSESISAFGFEGTGDPGTRGMVFTVDQLYLPGLLRRNPGRLYSLSPDGNSARYGDNRPTGPPTEVSIDGPTQGDTSVTYSFTANVIPFNAKLPIDYVWQAADQYDRTASDVYALNHTVAYTWSTPGLKVITVTAWNVSGSARDTHTILIEAILDNVEIYGPSRGVTHTVYAFAAVVSPSNASRSVAYAWSPDPMAGQGTAGATYLWEQPGTKIISVTATNSSGIVKVADTHTVTVGVAPEPVRKVHIDGPQAGLIHAVHIFTADVSPVTATQPITYAWMATEQADRTIVAYSSIQPVTFTWGTTGSKTVSVRASNTGNAITSTTIVIDAPPISAPRPSKVYLPAVARRWPPWEQEPNNKPFSQANGPLSSGENLYGYPNDAWDCFKFNLPSAGPIAISLTQQTAQGVQLLLYYQTQYNLIVQEPSEPYYVEYAGQPGLYCTCIYAVSGFNADLPYTLLGTFP